MVYFGPTRAGFQRRFQRRFQCDVQRRQHEHDFPMPQLKIRRERRDKKHDNFDHKSLLLDVFVCQNTFN